MTSLIIFYELLTRVLYLIVLNYVVDTVLILLCHEVYKNLVIHYHNFYEIVLETDKNFQSPGATSRSS